MMSIYVHIPFCKSKCAYCDFVSTADTKCNDADLVNDYFVALLDEIKLSATEFGAQKNTKGSSAKIQSPKVNSIYFGGGTPSEVCVSYIGRVLKQIKNTFDVCQNAEITLETNPCSLTAKKLTEYTNFGINRFSLGVQSFCDNTLKFLGRSHNSTDALKALSLLKNVRESTGANFSVDYLLGVPKQTKSDIDSLIDVVKEYNITHVSAYGLKIEKGTPLYKARTGINEDHAADLYEYLVEQLNDIKLNRYEVSNFAVSGFESIHNLNYWNYGNFLGFGVSAAGFIDGVHYTNPKKLDAYIAKLSDKKLASKKTKAPKSQQQFEYIMLNLRKEKGFNYTDFNKRFGSDFVKTYNTALNELSNKNLIILTENCVRVSPNKFYMLNTIILEFL
ncbi:MAG: radical SAM family heme chaperone HemW [Firmicutes bacterium]|nr:radical SAM family heme chaperone HemW [Bacillota bacterium]